MKNFLVLLGTCLLWQFASAQDTRPNIIYILADDLGYGDLGCYGQKIIETPHLDALRERGMLFTQHYSGAPVCAPARGSLLTGLHTGHAHVRGNDEWSERGAVWDYDAMFANPYLEGQRPLPDSVFTLADMLKTAGYRTGIVGKWGLGGPETESVPTTQGFDFFYGYNCQRQAHTYYPTHLWKNTERVLLENKTTMKNLGIPENLDPLSQKNYKDYIQEDFAPDLIHQEALQFINRNSDKPFFLYYASPIPHAPLQVPGQLLNYYQKVIGTEAPHIEKRYYPHPSPNAAYAAMVSYLDRQVGELVKLLKEKGIWENTLIIFTSDNGPSDAGGNHMDFFQSAAPFTSVFGKTKGFVHEGGIRVPMLACWPEKIKAGSTSHLLSSFYDMMATFADITKSATPSTDGISILPTLLGEEQKEKHAYLFWEFSEYGGQQAIRKGKWKAIRRDIQKGNLEIELYDLEKDLTEEKNIANQHPQIVEEMQAIFKKEHKTPSETKFKMAALEK